MPGLVETAQTFWKPFVEIMAFWSAAYLLFVYVKDSGMVQALKGLIILVVFFFAAQVFQLSSIHWVLGHFFQISIIGFLIIFQPELRRGLTRIGQSPLFKLFLKEEKLVDEITKAVIFIPQKKMGAWTAVGGKWILSPGWSKAPIFIGGHKNDGL